MDGPKVHGQIYDYMLRLKSFFGLQHVFGIVTTYEEWRFFWFSDSNAAAAANALPGDVPARNFRVADSGNEDEVFDEVENEDAVDVQFDPAFRHLQASAVYPWNYPTLPLLLASLIKKMNLSPLNPITRIDNERPYVIMGKSQWHWAKVSWSKSFKLHYYKMITKATKKFILIEDMHGGADGRVWLTCNSVGSVAVIKFAQGDKSMKADDAQAQLHKEAENWNAANEIDEARVQKIGGDWALVMPFGGKPAFVTGVAVSDENKALIRKRLQKIAAKGLEHADLAKVHVLIRSPQKKGNKTQPAQAVVVDCRRVKQTKANPETIVTAGMKKLGL